MRHVLLAISGPSGVGKGTMVKTLIARREDVVESVSCTTRAPREGEIHGKHYFFLSKEEFERRIQEGDFLEYDEHFGNYYGTPRKEAEAVLASGKNLILEIEVDGAGQVRKKFPEAVLIMLLPPDFATQESRLRGRGTETEEKILGRLAQTREELKHLDLYDYIVYNETGRSDVCKDDILSIVRAERLSRRRNPDAAKRYFGE